MQVTTHPFESFRGTLQAMARAHGHILAIPFDLARDNYARAVRAGLIERSMLDSARFTRTVGALERLTLGPWARGF